MGTPEMDTPELVLQAVQETARAIDNDRRAEVVSREAGKGGLRGRINAMCCACIYDPGAGGTWRMQTEKCTSTGCPLYAVRPLSGCGE